ncbi:MAG: hypothetical protein IJW96_03160 [Clostridia bacterium]|nr:hypothetical protein [Clostridia bacterium]
MTLKERQHELDIMKWYDSVNKRDDMCGEYIFCGKCNKENNNPCARAEHRYNMGYIRLGTVRRRHAGK